LLMQLPRLRTLCEVRLAAGVDVENAAWMHSRAVEANAQQLQAYCEYLMARHLDAVVKTAHWKALPEKGRAQLERRLLRHEFHNFEAADEGDGVSDDGGSDADGLGSRGGGGSGGEFAWCCCGPSDEEEEAAASAAHPEPMSRGDARP